MTPSETSNVRLRLLIPFILSLFIIVSGIQIILYFYQQNEQLEYAHELDIELDKAFKDSLNSEAEHTFGFLNFIKESNEIKQA